ncbi:DUF3302 domain-containing protein [Vibrio lentus]|uniref:DUF3302 domain-containing protein n=1 Tax=Vibrio lentus TaxID=136468 RepID=UPI000977DF5B|nr:DUF3302 domain-containing protein [Vibrio lentus]OMO28865.1 hypothetical protein BH583_01900 [Vibrio lentus]PMN09938.1 hypothetical protein BCT38_11940 [Vibrio lentus]
MNLTLDYLSLGILILVLLILVYGLVVIHDIPYEIAVKRNHPHQDAIHVAGWISLFCLHVMWPLLWVWAMLSEPLRATNTEQSKLDELEKRIDALQAKSEGEQ